MLQSWPEQVRQMYLPFDAAEMPSVLFLVDVDLGATAPEEYSQQAFGRFLKRAVEVGEQYFGEMLAPLRARE